MDIESFLPNMKHTIDGTGFLFGAGTSFEAGYPMMMGLTQKVVSSLTPGERTELNNVLDRVGLIYDDSIAKPNIEELADFVMAHSINSSDPCCIALESRLRELLVQEILSVRTPQLENHVRFFQALSNRAFGRPCSIWIFTTNYDLLFEIAAARAGVILENGFSGTIERFFNPNIYISKSGEITGSRFVPTSQLTIKLVKLHGSISWTTEGSHIIERHPDGISNTSSRVMVLPRKKKIMETLASPYGTLFAYMSRALGGECKYLLCCGFSFGDEHINQNILLPVIQSGRIRLFTFNEYEPGGVADFKQFQSFGGGYSNPILVPGVSAIPGTDLWKFSRFVTLF